MKQHTHSVDLRTSLCNTLTELSRENDRIVWLEADLMASSGMKAYQKQFPHRIFDCGIQEANMMGVAAGLAAEGFIPFIHSFSAFASRRIADQIFVAGVYSKSDVRIIGSDPGITACPNGGTHMSLEDVGILRSMPGTIILDPCDAVQLDQLLRQSILQKGIYYIRLDRKSLASFYEPESKFTIGRGYTVLDGCDATIITAGALCMTEVLKAADILEKAGISTRVIDMFTIKPLDKEILLKAAAETQAIVTVENHNIYNGLGSAAAEVLAEASAKTAFRRLGAPDTVGEVGSPAYLLEKYHMSGSYIAETVKELLK